MAKPPPKLDPGLLSQLLEHQEFSRPKQFSGVEWRDVADLRERLARLEQQSENSGQKKAEWSAWKIALVTAIISGPLGGVITVTLTNIIVPAHHSTEQQAGDMQADQDTAGRPEKSTK